MATCQDCGLLGRAIDEDHHDTIAASGWKITIWNNDDEDGLLYWSKSDSFDSGQALQNSDDWNGVALIIAPGPTVYCSEWN